MLSLRTAGPAAVLSHECDIPQIPTPCRSTTRLGDNRLLDTVPARSGSASCYCNPSCHANFATPCVLALFKLAHFNISGEFQYVQSASNNASRKPSHTQNTCEELFVPLEWAWQDNSWLHCTFGSPCLWHLPEGLCLNSNCSVEDCSEVKKLKQELHATLKHSLTLHKLNKHQQCIEKRHKEDKLSDEVMNVEESISCQQALLCSKERQCIYLTSTSVVCLYSNTQKKRMFVCLCKPEIPTTKYYVC